MHAMIARGNVVELGREVSVRVVQGIYRQTLHVIGPQVRQLGLVGALTCYRIDTDRSFGRLYIQS